MNCPNCGASVSVGQKFCTKCGSRIAGTEGKGGGAGRGFKPWIFFAVFAILFLVVGSSGRMGLQTPLPKDQPMAATAVSFGINLAVGWMVGRLFRSRSNRMPPNGGGSSVGLILLMGVVLEALKSTSWAHDYGFHEMRWTLSDPNLLGLLGVSGGGGAGFTLGLGLGAGPKSVDQMIKNQVTKFQNQYGGGPTTGPDVVAVEDLNPGAPWPTAASVAGSPDMPPDPNSTMTSIPPLPSYISNELTNEALNRDASSAVNLFRVRDPDTGTWGLDIPGLQAYFNNSYGVPPTPTAPSWMDPQDFARATALASSAVAKAMWIDAQDHPPGGGPGNYIPPAVFGNDPSRTRIVVNPPGFDPTQPNWDPKWMGAGWE